MHVLNVRVLYDGHDPVGPGEGVVVDDDVVTGEIRIVHQEHQVSSSYLQLILENSSFKTPLLIKEIQHNNNAFTTYLQNIAQF